MFLIQMSLGCLPWALSLFDVYFDHVCTTHKMVIITEERIQRRHSYHSGKPEHDLQNKTYVFSLWTIVLNYCEFLFTIASKRVLLQIYTFNIFIMHVLKKVIVAVLFWTDFTMLNNSSVHVWSTYMVLFWLHVRWETVAELRNISVVWMDVESVVVLLIQS